MSGSLATNGYICKPPSTITEHVTVIDVSVEVATKTIETSVEIVT